MERSEQRPRRTERASDGKNALRDFNRALRRLKKDFQKNVMPSMKRSRYHLSKGERRREKERKAERRLRRQQRKIASFR